MFLLKFLWTFHVPFSFQLFRSLPLFCFFLFSFLFFLVSFFFQNFKISVLDFARLEAPKFGVRSKRICERITILHIDTNEAIYFVNVWNTIKWGFTLSETR